MLRCVCCKGPTAGDSRLSLQGLFLLLVTTEKAKVGLNSLNVILLIKTFFLMDTMRPEWITCTPICDTSDRLLFSIVCKLNTSSNSVLLLRLSLEHLLVLFITRGAAGELLYTSHTSQ